MKLALDIEGFDKPIVVEIDSRDRRAFERRGAKDLGAPNLSALKDIVAAQPETYAIWLAWHALVFRQKRTQFGSWVDFESKVLGAPLLDENEEEPLADPTVKTR